MEYPPDSGGIGSYVYNLSNKLHEKGHSVTIITSGSEHSVVNKSHENVTVMRLPLLPLYPFHVYLYGYFVNNVLKRFENNFDIVHLHSPATPPIKTSLPVITTFIVQ
jgi:glycosyltransferase involved in cell wall biosynthesis